MGDGSRVLSANCRCDRQTHGVTVDVCMRTHTRVRVCGREGDKEGAHSEDGGEMCVEGGHKESVALKAIEKRCFLLTRGEEIS